jgi:hypothetical protein
MFSEGFRAGWRRGGVAWWADTYLEAMQHEYDGLTPSSLN